MVNFLCPYFGVRSSFGMYGDVTIWFAVFIIPVVCVTVSNFCVWFDWKEMNSERRWEVADPRDGVFRTKRFYTQCHVM